MEYDQYKPLKQSTKSDEIKITMLNINKARKVVRRSRAYRWWTGQGAVNAGLILETRPPNRRINSLERKNKNIFNFRKTNDVLIMCVK